MKVVPQEIIRLTPEVYASLEQKTVPLIVTHQTTALQTSFIAGQQSILKLLREGFVVG